MIPASNMTARQHLQLVLKISATLWALCLLPGGMAAADPLPDHYREGQRLESFTVGRTTYRVVVLKSISTRTVMFTHQGGMASIKLRDLPPEQQARFRYDPQAERASDEALHRATVERQARLAAAAQAAQAAEGSDGSRFDRVLRAFGSPAVPQPEVDLRPRFRELELHAKNQGRRPSCAVFAVVSALEYIHAENTGQAEKFSEEYLIWATRKSIQRTEQPPADELTGDDADTGFALTEVVTALRSYGIPLERSMPNTMGRALDAVPEPAPGVINEARARTRGAVHLVPGRDAATRLNNLVHALNAGLPVTIGTAWPRFFNMRAALLNSQEPSYSHAVTLVGYRCPSGRIEDTVFIFKNSWGANWGANGYGFATYDYLARHLHTAILLEVHFRP
jgi:hypothetical protein